MVHTIFAQATAAHSAGDVLLAESLYRQVLALAPEHADSLHLLGRLLCDAGQAQAALPLLGRAVKLRPRIAEYLAGLAEAQRGLGQTVDALETWRRAVRIKPDSAQLQYGHGVALAAAGHGALAVQALRRALARDPALAAAHSALGATLLSLGQAQAAADSFRAAQRLAPHDGTALFNLGCALQETSDLPNAEQAFRSALQAMPGHVPSQGNLSRVLRSAGRLQDAAEVLEQAVQTAPNDASLWLNLGLLRRDLSCFAGAEAAFRRAAELAPSADALACLGNVLRDQRRLAESESVLLAALARDDAHREAHTGLAFTRLLRGDLEAGWADFAWRGAAAPVRQTLSEIARAPAWKGETLDGALLIYAEQGAGDFIQMSRFVQRAAQRAKGVVLRVKPELRRLAATVAGAGQVISTEDRCPPCAAMCADLDLPGILGVGMKDVTVPVPYVQAGPAEIAAWRARLSQLPGRRIGLAWCGNPAYFHDTQRSVPAALLGALAGVTDVTFVSLQPSASPPADVAVTDWTAELHDFAATAALVSGLDLVIAVDSAVAHLAGALGRPVWLLNRYAPDWRWLLDRDDSPWYPTLRQFRQAAPGDWQGVLSHVRDALTAPGAFLP